MLVKLKADKALDSEAMASLGKDLAMQVAAANPISVDRESVNPEVIAKEREIYQTQAQSSGKPEKIWGKIVDGKLEKFFQEFTLVEQAFIRNPDVNIKSRIQETEKETGAKIKVLSFVRLELGAEE